MNLCLPHLSSEPVEKYIKIGEMNSKCHLYSDKTREMWWVDLIVQNLGRIFPPTTGRMVHCRDLSQPTGRMNAVGGQACSQEKAEGAELWRFTSLPQVHQWDSAGERPEGFHWWHSPSTERNIRHRGKHYSPIATPFGEMSSGACLFVMPYFIYLDSVGVQSGKQSSYCIRGKGVCYRK